MPYILDGTGLTLKTQPELVTQLTGQYQGIYGESIDLSSSSQDGQMMNVYIQVTLDVSTIILNAYNSRDINQAVGTQLDILMYWIQRQGGDETIQPLTVTTNGACTLYGLNQSVQPVFTYADAAGNQYQLQETQSPADAGSYIYNFQAAQPGAISSPLNSINVPVTVNLAVTSVNNPTIYTTLGQTEETDFNFRLRGLASVAISSQGFFNALYASLGNVPEASKIVLYENRADTISPNSTCSAIGVPPHGIWAIVQGTAAPVDVATAIYNQRSLGCNMKGSQTYNITQDDGSLFTVQWDNVVAQDVYIQFTATSINGVNPPNIAEILAKLPLSLVPGVGATMNINQVQAAVQAIDPNTLVTDAGLALAEIGPYESTLSPSANNYQFRVGALKIYITPMVLLPQTSSVASAATIQFTGYGGSQSGYTYSFVTNNSGGTINSSTGIYVAGSTPGIDTIQVEDSDSNTATATVTVS